MKTLEIIKKTGGLPDEVLINGNHVKLTLTRSSYFTEQGVDIRISDHRKGLSYKKISDDCVVAIEKDWLDFVFENKTQKQAIRSFAKIWREQGDRFISLATE